MMLFGREGVHKFGHIVLGFFAHNVRNYQLRLDISQYFLRSCLCLNAMLDKEFFNAAPFFKELGIQLF